MSDIDKARLESCVEGIKATLGDRFSKQQLVNAVLMHNFNTEHAIDFLLNSVENNTNLLGIKEKGVYYAQHFLL